MSERSEGHMATLDPAKAKAISDYNNLSPEERAKVDTQVTEIQAKVADGLLKLSGWDILRELYQLAMQRVLATSRFTMPVLHLREDIIQRLSDPVGFSKSFQTLCSDLQRCAITIKTLGERHLGKEGTPSTEDQVLIFELANDYNQIFTTMETVYDPLIYALQETIFKECKDLFDDVQVEPEPAQ